MKRIDRFPYFESASPERISSEPVGDWRPAKGLLETRDALCTFRRGDGSEYSERKPGYYTRLVPGHEHLDVCMYCGVDSTGARIGHCCFNCGGN